MSAEPTNREVIASAMEPAPALPSAYSYQLPSPLGWWILGETMHGGMRWYPNIHTLDRLRRVEERLTDAQWRDYRREFRGVVERPNGTWPLGDRIKDALHASAEQKIAALASVLRETKRA